MESHRGNRELMFSKCRTGSRIIYSTHINGAPYLLNPLIPEPRGYNEIYPFQIKKAELDDTSGSIDVEGLRAWPGSLARKPGVLETPAICSPIGCGGEVVPEAADATNSDRGRLLGIYRRNGRSFSSICFSNSRLISCIRASVISNQICWRSANEMSSGTVRLRVALACTQPFSCPIAS